MAEAAKVTKRSMWKGFGVLVLGVVVGGLIVYVLGATILKKPLASIEEKFGG